MESIGAGQWRARVRTLPYPTISLHTHIHHNRLAQRILFLPKPVFSSSFIRMYACIYVRMYVCMFVYIRICVCVYKYMYVCICTINQTMHVMIAYSYDMYMTQLKMCMSTCMSACMYVCI